MKLPSRVVFVGTPMGPLNQVRVSLTLLNLTWVAKPASSVDQVIHLTRHMPPLGIIGLTLKR